MKPTLSSFLLGLAMALAGAAGTSIAQAESGVQLITTAELEIESVNAEGEKVIQRIEATRVVPGDEVIYTITYTNSGPDPAENIVITNPIPEHMIFTGSSGTADETRVEFSVDGGKTYDLLENLRLPTADGGDRAAAPADVTHIQWTLLTALMPGAGGLVDYRAVLQ